MKKILLILLTFTSLLILVNCNRNHNHVYSDKWSYDEEYHWHRCIDCDAASDKDKHDFDDGVVTKNATDKEFGEKTYTCKVCGKTKVEQIDKLAHTHNYSSWQSDSLRHFKICDCGDKIEVNFHEWDEDGKCKVCGKVKEEKDTYTVTISYDDEIVYHTVYFTFGEEGIDDNVFEVAANTVIDLCATTYEIYDDKYHIDNVYVNGRKYNFELVSFYIESYIKVEEDLFIEITIAQGPYESVEIGPDNGVLLTIDYDKNVVFTSLYVNYDRITERELYVFDGSSIRMLIAIMDAYKNVYDYEVIINGQIISLEEVGAGHEFYYTIDGETNIEIVLHEIDTSNEEDITYNNPIIKEDVEYERLSEFAKENNSSCGIDSIGDVEVLVIPIAFNNSKDYDLSIIEKAFNGTIQDTGWQSLNSYYLESSMGKLNITANILDPYQTGIDYDHKKGQIYDKNNADQQFSDIYDYRFLTEALDYYDNLGFDFSKYDSNEDGMLDTVFLIYLAPYGTINSSLWWAYDWTYLYDNDHVYDELRLANYLWMSIEFFDISINEQYFQVEKEYIDINCETLIHEAGHALGLEDYYDKFNNGRLRGGLGLLNMMDGNQCDHDPFSKALLGWINPDIVYGVDYEVTLNSFGNSGECVFVASENNGSYFEEFYVICFYTPDGLNEYKAKDEYGIYNIPGILVYHVNSTLAENYDSVNDIAMIYKYNNGGYRNRLIEIVPHGDNIIDVSKCVNNTDLYLEGDSLTIERFGFTMTVTSLSSTQATISISFN